MLVFCDISSNMSICLEEIRTMKIFVVGIYILSIGLYP